MDERETFREAVCRAVAQVPRGSVASYGQIAWMAGYPRRPRQVGMVLKGLPEGTDLPWHRIVSVKGYVPSRGRWWGAMLQIQRLRDEGIDVDDAGNLDLDRFGWNGDQSSSRSGFSR
jgi:methylated-DNA-protein-cysteine methyltransferase-like protein